MCQLETLWCRDHWRLKNCFNFQGQFDPWYLLLLHYFPPLHLCIDSILGVQVAYIELNLRQVRHYICQSAASENARSNGQPFAPAVESSKLEDLMGQLYYSIAPIFWLETGVRRATVRGKRVPGIALTCANTIPIVSRRLYSASAVPKAG